MLLRPLLRPVLREPLRSPFTRRGGFNPLSLFSAGEQGGWYDPSDFSTMFQDSAGTTPVTAVGQPVGKILDKSGRGNHLIQATTTSRPLLQQDGSGFYYLSFDGVDDSLASAATVDFTGTSKMTAFAGVRKNSDAATGVLLELSADVSANNGAFLLDAPDGAANYGFYCRNGAVLSGRIATTFAAPISNVLTGQFDFTQGSAAAQNAPRVDGATPALTAGSLVGNAAFGNYTLYVGRRGGATLPFNGRIYQLIVRGALSSAAQIASGERLVGGRMGIPL